MKTLTTTKTIEEIIGYEASDGTQFKTKEECEKYENTAAYVITERFKKLVVKEMEGIDITEEANAFCLSSIDEDWYYVLIEIKNDDDLKVAQMYQKLVGFGSANKGFTTEMIGKRIIVGAGEGVYPRPESGKRCNYEYCYIWGTIEEQIEKYARTLRKLEEVNDNGKQTTDM